MIEWAEKYPGECVSCGFLGQYQTGAPGILLDVHAGYRASGSMSGGNGLWCLRRAANLEAEVKAKQKELTSSPSGYAAGDSVLHHARRQVMQEAGRHCPDWYEWVEYFDPKWHYEDWRMHQLMEEQTRVAADHATTARALTAVTERNERQTTEFNRYFLILALATIVLAR